MEADNVWEKIKKGLRDGAAMSIDKIEEFSKVGKLKVEELAAKRKVERNFMDIGERVFDLIGEGKGAQVEEDLTVKKAVDNIKGLKEELAAVADKIQLVTEEARIAREKSGEEEEVTGV